MVNKALPIFLIAIIFCLSSATRNVVSAQSALRCGYERLPPLFVGDPKKEAPSGLSVDVWKEIGQRLGRPVEWTEEVSSASAFESLNAGRIDAFCTANYRFAPLTKKMAYTDTLFYSATHFFARAKDDRFNNNDSRINKPDITLAFPNDAIHREGRIQDFAKTIPLALPPEAPHTALLEAVAQEKADIALANPLFAATYIRDHSQTLRIVPGLYAYRLYAHAFAVAKDNEPLLLALNKALAAMHKDGSINLFLTQQALSSDAIIKINDLKQGP